MALKRPLSRQRGMTMVYCAIIVPILVLITALCVDVGRARTAKFELQSAADSASRHAATGLGTNVQTAINNAVAAAGENKTEQTQVVLNQADDIEFGVWDPADRSFTKLAGAARSGATAVRITARRTAARGNAIPAMFAQAMGRRTIDVTAVAIATRGNIVSPVIDAKSCLWLAGMPNGSVVTPYAENTQGSYAPSCSPPQISGIPITPGTTLSFRETSGSTGDAQLGNGAMGLDGVTDLDKMATQRSANGINATTAPRGALMGLFLDANAPNSYPAAAALDFADPATRNQTNYSPGLKQVFFIGDGLTDNETLQKFMVPAGATRLYLGIMDEKGWWWDNTGEAHTTMLNAKVKLVK